MGIEVFIFLLAVSAARTFLNTIFLIISLRILKIDYQILGLTVISMIVMSFLTIMIFYFGGYEKLIWGIAMLFEAWMILKWTNASYYFSEALLAVSIACVGHVLIAMILMSASSGMVLDAEKKAEKARMEAMVLPDSHS